MYTGAKYHLIPRRAFLLAGQPCLGALSAAICSIAVKRRHVLARNLPHAYQPSPCKVQGYLGREHYLTSLAAPASFPCTVPAPGSAGYGRCSLSGGREIYLCCMCWQDIHSLRFRNNHLQESISLTLCPLIRDYRLVLILPLLVWSFTRQVWPCPEATRHRSWDQAFLCVSII